MESAEAKPDATIGSTGSGDEFYAWCARGELRLRRCNACHAWCHVPRVICPVCAARDWSWQPVRGTGRVYTWTIVHRAMHPAFVGDVPYAVVVVALDEGPRIVSRIADCPLEELAMEMPVEVVFERGDRLGERVLPRFKRASRAAVGAMR